MDLPRFPLGFPVNLGYLGLYRADTCGTRRNGERLPKGNGRVIALRLIAEDDEREIPGTDGRMEDVMTYPNGWEYQLSTGSEHEACGWYTEAEVLEEGYPFEEAEAERPQPGDDTHGNSDDVQECRRAWDDVPAAK